MRARRGLRVVLNTEDWFVLVPHSFHRLVVQVDAVDADVCREGFVIDGESMILGGDLDLAAFEIFHRLISSAVSKLQLERFSAESLPQDLMPQADSENGNP